MWTSLAIWPNLSPWNELGKSQLLSLDGQTQKAALKTRLRKVITQVNIRDTLTINLRVASYSAFLLERSTGR